MAWFAAHAIMYHELIAGPQDEFLIYENVYLIRAATSDEAYEKATALARNDEGDSQGSLRVGDKLARRVFGSIRKVTAVCHVSPDDEIGDGDELTYSEFVVIDRATLESLLQAEDVDLLYLGKQPNVD